MTMSRCVSLFLLLVLTLTVQSASSIAAQQKGDADDSSNQPPVHNGVERIHTLPAKIPPKFKHNLNNTSTVHYNTSTNLINADSTNNVKPIVVIKNNVDDNDSEMNNVVEDPSNNLFKNANQNSIAVNITKESNKQKGRNAHKVNAKLNNTSDSSDSKTNVVEEHLEKRNTSATKSPVITKDENINDDNNNEEGKQNLGNKIITPERSEENDGENKDGEQKNSKEKKGKTEDKEGKGGKNANSHDNAADDRKPEDKGKVDKGVNSSDAKVITDPNNKVKQKVKQLQANHTQSIDEHKELLAKAKTQKKGGIKVAQKVDEKGGILTKPSDVRDRKGGLKKAGQVNNRDGNKLNSLPKVTNSSTNNNETTNVKSNSKDKARVNISKSSQVMKEDLEIIDSSSEEDSSSMDESSEENQPKSQSRPHLQPTKVNTHVTKKPKAIPNNPVIQAHRLSNSVTSDTNTNVKPKQKPHKQIPQRPNSPLLHVHQLNNANIDDKKTNAKSKDIIMPILYDHHHPEKKAKLSKSEAYKIIPNPKKIVDATEKVTTLQNHDIMMNAPSTPQTPTKEQRISQDKEKKDAANLDSIKSQHNDKQASTNETIFKYQDITKQTTAHKDFTNQEVITLQNDIKANAPPEKEKVQSLSSKLNERRRFMNNVVSVVSILLITVATVGTIAGVCYKTMSFSKKRYSQHVPLSTEENDMVLFNKLTTYDDYDLPYQSWRDLV